MSASKQYPGLASKSPLPQVQHLRVPQATTHRVQANQVEPVPKASAASQADRQPKGNGSAFISQSNVDKRCDRARDWDRKRQLEAAYNDDFKIRPKGAASKKSKMSKRDARVNSLVQDTKNLYNAKDGKLFLNRSSVARRLLAEHVLKVCAGRGLKIDAAVSSDAQEFTRGTVLRCFPGLASLVAVSPKVEGYKPSQENNPDPKVYNEGIRPLGNKFFDPVIKQIIRIAVRQYRVYARMCMFEGSPDDKDKEEYNALREYLEAECVELLMWKCYDGDDRHSQQKRDTAFNEHPMNRMLEFLEHTCARTRIKGFKNFHAREQTRESGLTINDKIIDETIDHIIREHSERDGTRGRDPSDTHEPDPVLYAVLKETHGMLAQGLKQFTDAGRVNAVGYLTERIGIPYFKMASTDNDDFTASVEEPVPRGDGDTVASFSSGISEIRDAEIFPASDEHGIRTAIPQTLEDLKVNMSSDSMESNKQALSDLHDASPEMICTVRTRKYVTKKNTSGRKFDTNRCSRIISAAEDVMREDPEQFPVTYKFSLHRVALTFLCNYVQVYDSSALLATHKTSLRAVCAVALSLYGILLSSGSKALCPVLEAHTGPMTLMYQTKTKPKLIGLMGVKKLPSRFAGEGSPGDEASILDSNQFDRDLQCLKSEYQEFLKDLMFITPAECRKLERSSATSQRESLDSEGDSDDSDWDAPAKGGKGPGSDNSSDDDEDNITGALSDMEDGF